MKESFEKIVNSVASCLNVTWSTLVIKCVCDDECEMETVSFDAFDEKGGQIKMPFDEGWPEDPEEPNKEFRKLRGAMKEANGLWYIAVITVQKDGEFTSKFDYEQPES